MEEFKPVEASQDVHLPDEARRHQEPMTAPMHDELPPALDQGLVRALLKEQGEDGRSIETLAPALTRLGEWQGPVPTEADTQQLVSVLLPVVPCPAATLPSTTAAAATSAPTAALSVAGSYALAMAAEAEGVRQAVRQRFARFGSSLGWLLEVALLQSMLLRPSFCLASAFISALGVLAVVSGVPVPAPGNGIFILRLLGPLLAVFGVAVAFRSVRLNMLEMELSCPVSPLRLTIARLVLVLGYDVALGLGMSTMLIVLNGQGVSRQEWSADLLGLVLATVGHWLAPLLLVAGLALLLCLRMPVETAAVLAYGGWLTLLVLALVEGTNRVPGPFTALLSSGEALFALAGVLLVIGALWRLRASLPALLPGG